MHVFIPLIISLLIPSAVEMSQATTGEFRRWFLKWNNASEVRVSCKKENDTKPTLIALYCNESIEICRKNPNKTGVSLEKDQDGFYLTIKNDSYDSWFCEAKAYIDDEEKMENFTVFRKQPTNTSPSPGATDPSPSTEHWLYVCLFIGLFILILIIIGVYKKVKSCRNTTGHLNRENQQDLEMGQRAVTGENEPMQEDKVMLETEVLGQNGKMLENGELGENGQQEGRQAKIKKKRLFRMLHELQECFEVKLIQST